MRLGRTTVLVCTAALSLIAWDCLNAGQPDNDQAYNADTALETSTGAVGNMIPNVEMIRADGKTISLHRYIGKPLLVSFIFTSCYHVCPAITRHLKSAVREAEDSLGEDSFNVLTIGFDTANDTPAAMAIFAAEQSVNEDNWDFLSASPDVIDSLTETLGFVYFPSPRGFDHINQVTVIDKDGIIYRQVYGAAFDLPWLMEPLKQVVLNHPEPGGQIIDGLWDRVRLFCTVYDPRTGRYRFDYSLFIQIGVGALVILSVLAYLFIEYWRSRRRKSGS